MAVCVKEDHRDMARNNVDVARDVKKDAKDMKIRPCRE